MKNFTFTLGGINYRGNHIDVMKQFHVSRRLAPMIVGLKRLLPKLLQQSAPEDILAAAKLGQLDSSTEMMIADLEPLLEALNRMTDEDADYIIGVCLTSLQREMVNGLGWTAVWSPGNPGQLMFTDITMPQMMQMVAMVIWNNLRGFMPGVLQGSPSPAPGTSLG